MQYAMGVITGLIVIVLFLLFKYQNRKMKKTETEFRELKQKMARMESGMSDMEKFRRIVWENANTIHLYAALSGEEAKTDSLKEKQKQIRQMAEELLEKVK